MIRPASFGFNPETAENNAFQAKALEEPAGEVRKKALAEFDNMVRVLEAEGVRVVVIDDSDTPPKPDAVFPNNWITTHADGSVITYPMYSPLRRLERREDVIDKIKAAYKVEKRYSFEQYEEKNQYLEGTGSLVLDRVHKVAYACLSPRTHIGLLDTFGILKGYRVVHFEARAGGMEIYHTNVLMAMGPGFVVICRNAVTKDSDWDKLEKVFRDTAKEIIEITVDQMHHFAGNMLALNTLSGKSLVVMSESALSSLEKEQVDRLEAHGKIISVPIPTIEKYGGGSARCMIAEIFLESGPEKA